MDILMQLLPLVLPVLISAAVAAIKTNVLAKIPSQYFPVLIPAAAGIVTGFANYFGVEVGDLTSGDTSSWEAAIVGVLLGWAAVGAHQTKKQLKP